MAGRVARDRAIVLPRWTSPLATVSNLSVHRDRDEAIRRGREGFEFFGYAVNALVAYDTVPGRGCRGKRSRAAPKEGGRPVRQDADRMSALRREGCRRGQQAGHNRHAHICEAPELFAAEVPEFKAEAAGREARTAWELAPHIAAALARKTWMQPLAPEEIPIVRA